MVAILNIIFFHKTNAIYVNGELKHLNDDIRDFRNSLDEITGKIQKDKKARIIHTYKFKDPDCTMAASANLPTYWSSDLIELLEHKNERIEGENRLKNAVQ